MMPGQLESRSRTWKHACCSFWIQKIKTSYMVITWKSLMQNEKFPKTLIQYAKFPWIFYATYGWNLSKITFPKFFCTLLDLSKVIMAIHDISTNNQKWGQTIDPTMTKNFYGVYVQSQYANTSFHPPIYEYVISVLFLKLLFFEQKFAKVSYFYLMGNICYTSGGTTENPWNE